MNAVPIFFHGVMRYTVIVLCLSVSACALPKAMLPVWQKAPVAVAFTVKLASLAELPMQGGMEIHAQGGRMALITQHGRTLGQCQWQEQSLEMSTASMPLAEQAMALQCTASEGLGGQVKALVQRVALANYRILYGDTHAQQEMEQEYTITRQGDVYTYSDAGESMEITFSTQK